MNLEKQFSTHISIQNEEEKKITNKHFVLKFTIDCPDPHTYTHICMRVFFVYVRSAGRRCGVCRFRINGATDFYRFRFSRTRF